jgi:hypothetical protein
VMLSFWVLLANFSFTLFLSTTGFPSITISAFSLSNSLPQFLV